MRVVMADMPATVKAYTIFNDGFYTIVLNSRLSYEQNMLSYKHEMSHIEHDDFYSDLSASEIEVIRHGQG